MILNLQSAICNLKSCLRRAAVFVILLLTFTASARSQQPMPQVGDTVRGVFIGDWLQHAPEGGEVFHGKPVLLEFWATWCHPCLKAVPHLNELYREFGDEIQFVAITQEPPVVAVPVLKKHPMDYAVASDTKQGTTHKVFGVWVIPRTYILGPDRVVRWTGHPMRLTAEMLRTFLKTD